MKNLENIVLGSREDIMPRTGVYTVQLVEFEHEGKPRSYSTYTKQCFFLPAVQSTVHGYDT